VKRRAKRRKKKRGRTRPVKRRVFNFARFIDDAKRTREMERREKRMKVESF